MFIDIRDNFVAGGADIALPEVMCTESNTIKHTIRQAEFPARQYGRVWEGTYHLRYSPTPPTKIPRSPHMPMPTALCDADQLSRLQRRDHEETFARCLISSILASISSRVRTPLWIINRVTEWTQRS